MIFLLSLLIVFTVKGIMESVGGRRQQVLGKTDTITKNYMKNNSVFADAFNYYVYGECR